MTFVLNWWVTKRMFLEGDRKAAAMFLPFLPFVKKWDHNLNWEGQTKINFSAQVKKGEFH